MRQEDVLADWFRRIWVEGEQDAVDRIFAPQTEAGGLLPGFSLRAEDFKTLVEATLAMIAVERVDMLKTVSAGDWLSAMTVMRCVAHETGQKVDLHGQVMLRFDDGRIAEAYNHYDMIGFFQQMGVLPPDTMEHMLSGGRLV